MKKHCIAFFLLLTLLLCAGCSLPALSEEAKESRQRLEKLEAMAVDYTPDLIRSSMEAAVAKGETKSELCVRFPEGSGLTAELLGEEITGASKESFEIGYFTERIAYSIKQEESFRHVSIDYTYNSKQADRDDYLPGGRFDFGLYAKDVCADLLRDASAREASVSTAVFRTDGSADAQTVESDLLDTYYADEYLLYAMTDLRYEINDDYPDRIILSLRPKYRAGRANDIFDLVGNSDLSLVEHLIRENNQWESPVAIHMPSDRDEDDIAFLVEVAFKNDCADVTSEPFQYWVETYEGKSGAILTVTFDYHPDPETRAAKQAEFKEALNAAAAELSEELALSEGYFGDERDAYYLIANYICDHVDYDDDLADLVNAGTELSSEQSFETSAYGALIDGWSICSGYAALFKALCDAMDLPSWLVIGDVPDDEGSFSHAWNAVYVNGGIRYVDTTFMDSGFSETYFLFEDYTVDDRMTASGWVMPW